MLYKTQTATKPNKPCADSPANTPVILSITDIFGQNGIPCPLNNISRTMPRATNDTPTSASADAHPLIDFTISILSPLWLTSSQLVYLPQVRSVNKLPYLVVDVCAVVKNLYVVIKKGGYTPF